MADISVHRVMARQSALSAAAVLSALLGADSECTVCRGCTDCVNVIYKLHFDKRRYIEGRLTTEGNSTWPCTWCLLDRKGSETAGYCAK